MPKPQHPALTDFNVIISVPVQWGDLDAYGHLNNTVFFRFFESARIEYLKQSGFIDTYENHRVGAILHSTQCRFRRAVMFPDEVFVGARVTAYGHDRFTHAYRMVSREQASVVADGSGVIVSFDYGAGTKTALPDSVREGILRIETVPPQNESDQ